MFVRSEIERGVTIKMISVVVDGIKPRWDFAIVGPCDQ